MNYRLLAEITGPAGTTLGSVVVDPDWSAAREWCHFQGMRDGRRLTFAGAGPIAVEPEWHAADGPPRVGRFRIELTDANGEPFSCAISPRYLRGDVENAAADMVARGLIEAGSQFEYEICAYPDPQSPSRAEPDDLEGDALAADTRLEPASLSDAIARSERCGGAAWCDDDVPVFIPEAVIEALRAGARADAELESGALLVGHLCRDSDGTDERPELFVQVTAHIPARHTVATRTSLTFTPRTWSDAEGVLRLRARNEITVGWAHSHPFFCRDCGERERRVCPLARPLFSAADIGVHQTVFAHAWEIALLMSFLGENQPRVDLFAWREGQIVPRGFYVC